MQAARIKGRPGIGCPDGRDVIARQLGRASDVCRRPKRTVADGARTWLSKIAAVPRRSEMADGIDRSKEGEATIIHRPGNRGQHNFPIDQCSEFLWAVGGGASILGRLRVEPGRPAQAPRQAIAASSRGAAFKPTTAVSKGILEFKPAKPQSAQRTSADRCCHRTPRRRSDHEPPPRRPCRQEWPRAAARRHPR
jgi:hypothetical protein